MTDETAIATAATRWAVERLGDSAYAARCLSFVEDAIERSNGIEIFGARDVEALRPRARWTMPRLLGWFPLSRVLQGHRPRRWGDA